MEEIIHVNDLSKHFKINKHHRGFLGPIRNLTTRQFTNIKAVDGISFAIQPGELVGYLGPNGAGKSTTIKMLTGLLVPTAGELIVDKFIPWKAAQNLRGRNWCGFWSAYLTLVGFAIG